MQIQIFTIPILAGEKELEQLNHFLRANKIIDVRKEIVTSEGYCYWTFCVTYMTDGRAASYPTADNQRRDKVDYKEVLDEEAFARFTRMRKLRKQIATDEAVPAYAIFTDAELAEMAKMKELSVAAMTKIKGIGQKRVEKYGNAFCLIDYTQLDNETGWEADRADS